MYEMRGQAWLKQFTQGYPTKGLQAEPAAYPTANVEAPKLWREGLMGEAKGRLVSPKKTDPKTGGLREEVLR